MTFRLAVGGIAHETNQYVPSPTDLTRFTVHEGDELLSAVAGRTYVGSMVAAARELGADLVGTLHAYASPWGEIDAQTYADLKGRLIARVRAALPLDAAVLDVHGAGAVAGIDDLEADLCGAVR